MQQIGKKRLRPWGLLRAGNSSEAKRARFKAVYYDTRGGKNAEESLRAPLTDERENKGNMRNLCSRWYWDGTEDLHHYREAVAVKKGESLRVLRGDSTNTNY